MTATPVLSLTAPPGHTLAETVCLAFAARGTALSRQTGADQAGAISGGTLRLSIERDGQATVTLTDPAAMLELAEDLHPDQPLLPRDPVQRAEHRQALAVMARLATLTDRLTQTTDQRDIDLNTHLLREQLARIAPLLAGSGHVPRAILLVDLALAPLLWRITALDRAFDTHLLSGFDALLARHVWLIRHPVLDDVLLPSRLADWLDSIRRNNALISRVQDRVDWSGALGPAGRSGKKVSVLPPRTEIHSIGSNGRIR